MKNISGGMLCLAFICLHAFQAQAQENLVPNSSFEILTDCNVGSGFIYKALPWYSPSNEYNDNYLWGTVVNRCAAFGTSGNVPFPCGGYCYQEPLSGDGYAGIILNAAAAQGLLVRNYIGTPLLDTLEAGTWYMVSFFVNNENTKEYGSNNIGMLLTDTLTTRSYEGGGYILANPQIMAYGNPIYADTQSWMQVASVYQAQGWESAIMIGDFFGDTEDTLIINPGGQGAASYSIDDVSITPLDSLPRIFIAGPDTSVLLGSSVKIGTLINGLPGMLWYDQTGTLISTGPPQVSVSPTVNTWYRAEVTVGGTTYRDTVDVAVISLGVEDMPGKKGIGISISPNPTTGLLSVVLPDGNESWLLTITDIQGRKVKQLKANGGALNLTLDAAPGIYFIRVANLSTGFVETKKVTLTR